MIPEGVLRLMPGRIINLHTSFLPFNRGSAPNFFSFWDNTPKGVTIHLVDQGLDTGDILCQRQLTFDESRETFASTYDKLLAAIQELFRENWEKIKTGELAPRRQAGEGTCHRLKDLEAIREKHAFVWEDVIADFKKSLGDSYDFHSGRCQ